MVGPATRPFVAHYIASYGEVPLWVLSNDLTFRNMSHFFQLMKSGDQNSVCKYLFETTLRTEGDRKITPHEVLRAYDVLTHFRNSCAHDECLYCAKVGNDGYVTMLKLMEVALPRDVVRSMKKEIERLLKKYSDKLNVITAHDLGNCLGCRAARAPNPEAAAGTGAPAAASVSPRRQAVRLRLGSALRRIARGPRRLGLGIDAGSLRPVGNYTEHSRSPAFPTGSPAPSGGCARSALAWPRARRSR